MKDEGVSLWRQISAAITGEISDGTLAPGDKLPASSRLAARFGVNRHTVLRAIAHLQEEGLVRTQRGGGIYVGEAIPYRIDDRTRFEENLLEFNRIPSREIVSVAAVRATTDIARELRLDPGEAVILMTQLGAADGIPVYLSRNYFPAKRFPKLADVFEALLKSGNPAPPTRDTLEAQGVEDFRRRTVRITSRYAARDEAQKLRISPSEMLLEIEVVNVDRTGAPVTYGVSLFCGSRIKLVMELE